MNYDQLQVNEELNKNQWLTVCKDHRDKIKVPDPVVKDLISKTIVKQII